MVGPIDVKRKGSALVGHWADCMTLPFDHTHDLDLGVSRSESEIALSQEWGGRFIMNEKDVTDVSHPFMTMILTCVTMVRWADVPDSDRGDFRRWRAVDISSYQLLCCERWSQSCKLPGLWWCHMATLYLVYIGSGNGLLPWHEIPVKSLPEPMLTCHHWSPVVITGGPI